MNLKQNKEVVHSYTGHVKQMGLERLSTHHKAQSKQQYCSLPQPLTTIISGYLDSVSHLSRLKLIILFC